MAIKAQNTGGGNRVEQPTIEPGSYPNRLVQVIDLGLQAQRPYKGQEKAPIQEIMLTYELVDTFMIDENGEDREDKPRWISETIPLHWIGAERAKSTQRYLALDPESVHEGDFSKLVGVPSNVTLVTNVSGGKVYTNVASLTKMRAKDAEKVPELKNPAKVFSLDEPDMEVFNSLPTWIQDKIKGNLNFEGSAFQKALSKGGAKASAKAPVKDPVGKIPEKDEDEDNRPF